MFREDKKEQYVCLFNFPPHIQTQKERETAEWVLPPPLSRHLRVVFPLHFA